jgi:hypothetical protein
VTGALPVATAPSDTPRRRRSPERNERPLSEFASIPHRSSANRPPTDRFDEVTRPWGITRIVRGQGMIIHREARSALTYGRPVACEPRFSAGIFLPADARIAMRRSACYAGERRRRNNPATVAKVIRTTSIRGRPRELARQRFAGRGSGRGAKNLAASEPRRRRQHPWLGGVQRDRHGPDW